MPSATGLDGAALTKPQSPKLAARLPSGPVGPWGPTIGGQPDEHQPRLGEGVGDTSRSGGLGDWLGGGRMAMQGTAGDDRWQGGLAGGGQIVAGWAGKQWHEGLAGAGAGEQQ